MRKHLENVYSNLGIKLNGEQDFLWRVLGLKGRSHLTADEHVTKAKG
jgi:hypothetical protein